MYTAEYHHPRTPVVEYEEYFGVETVTVNLWWTNESAHPLVMYHVYATPSSSVAMMIVTSNTTANVTLSYNTQYVLSTVADFCGLSNATSASIELNYGEYIYIKLVAN